ncbi:cyclin-like protein [Pilobolus umbonatus]|nr:cyclin-like protein [Pilobolus umbonatus]
MNPLLSYRENNRQRITTQEKKGALTVKETYTDQSRILTDKSNSKTQYQVYQTNKAIQTNTIQKEKDISVYNVDDTHRYKEVKVKDVIEKKAEVDDFEAYVNDFFEDNKARYAEEEDDFEIVPVLPIKVPQRIQHIFKDNKRRRDDDDSTPSSKKLRTKEPTSKQFEQDIIAKLINLQNKHAARGKDPIDKMMMYEYSDEIFANLYAHETTTMANPGYAGTQQHEVSWKMRSVLIDWVIEIHCLFQLLPETLFLAVNIIDRFLSLRTVVLGKLQLVGITALFIATKFEEISSPTIQDFLYMTDKAVKEEELVKAECFILKVIDFRMCYANPLNFLRRIYVREENCDIHTRMLAKYFMEVSCVDNRFMETRPSAIAAASLWLAKKMLLRGNWSDHLTELSGYTTNDMKSIVETMLDFLSQPVVHDAFFRKWSSKKLSKAGIFVRDWINKYYNNEI